MAPPHSSRVIVVFPTCPWVAGLCLSAMIGRFSFMAAVSKSFSGVQASEMSAILHKTRQRLTSFKRLGHTNWTPELQTLVSLGSNPSCQGPLRDLKLHQLHLFALGLARCKDLPGPWGAEACENLGRDKGFWRDGTHWKKTTVYMLHNIYIYKYKIHIQCIYRIQCMMYIYNIYIYIYIL